MDAANVIVGSGKMMIAPAGTDDPDLTDLTDGAVEWPVGWVESGYTDDGVEFQYAPTFKDINVDEEEAPVQKKRTGEKLTVVAKLAEVTLRNLGYAVDGSKIVTAAATAQAYGTITFTAGSGDTKEFKVGFEGPAPGTGLLRAILVHRVKATGSVAQKYQRQDKVVFGVQFEGLADSSKPKGERLFKIVDFLPKTGA